jgi:hypothetical protein
MFFASPVVSNDQRVYVTSLANITSSSPSKKNWSRRNDDEPNHPFRKFFDRILLRRPDDDDIVDDSIALGDSKRLQLSIIAEQQRAEDREIYCCSSDEGDYVISKMKKTATFHLSEGHLKEALYTLTKCLALQQKLHGKESVEVAETFNMMGTIMANIGTEYHYRAMTAFEQALEIYQQQLGFGSEESAVCLKNLYLLLHQQRIHIKSDEEDKTDVSFHDFNPSTQVY